MRDTWQVAASVPRAPFPSRAPALPAVADMGGHRPGSEPLAGDHLVIRRSGYTHHGIYLGAGVIAHKVAGTAVLGVALSRVDASVRAGSGGVMLTTLPGFCPEAASASDWSLVSVVEYAECFAPEDTVALARGAAAQSAPYRLLEANCEHFASWCKVGEAVSLQVLAFRGFVRRFGALLAGGVAGVAVLARLEAVERTITSVTHTRGRGVRGALGLGRRKVVVTETTVAEGQVLLGAALIGAAAATAAGTVARLQAALAAQRSYRLALPGAGDVEAPPARRKPGVLDTALGASASASVAASAAVVDALAGAAGGAAAAHVVVLARAAVARGGLDALRQHLVAAGGAGAALLVWRAAAAAWEPLLDATQLPRCASLRLA